MKQTWTESSKMSCDPKVKFNRTRSPEVKVTGSKQRYSESNQKPHERRSTSHGYWLRSVSEFIGLEGYKYDRHMMVIWPLGF